jgi:hypothetical protein
MLNYLRATLDEVMTLLDAGVMIYRRHVSSFLALAGIFSLPAMIITFQLLFTIEDLFEASVEDILLLTSSLLLVPLLMTPPLIRAMQLVLAGHPPSLRNVIWQRPQIGRGLLAVGYSGLLAMMWMTIFFVIFGFFFGISCGVIFFVLYIILFVSVMTNSLFGALFLPLLLFLFLVTYLLYLCLSVQVCWRHCTEHNRYSIVPFRCVRLFVYRGAFCSLVSDIICWFLSVQR